MTIRIKKFTPEQSAALRGYEKAAKDFPVGVIFIFNRETLGGTLWFDKVPYPINSARQLKRVFKELSASRTIEYAQPIRTEPEKPKSEFDALVARAKKAIINDESVIYDVADYRGQLLDNVKNTRWFLDEVCLRLCNDYAKYRHLTCYLPRDSFYEV